MQNIMNVIRVLTIEELNKLLRAVESGNIDGLPELSAKLEELRNSIKAADWNQQALLNIQDYQKIAFLHEIMPEFTEFWSRLSQLPNITPAMIELKKVTIKEGNDTKQVLQTHTPAPEITGLVFSGGGAKGSVYPGVLRALENRGQMSKIERVAGSSAGAMTALLVSIGYTANELEQVVLTIDWRSLVNVSLANGRDEGVLVTNFIAELDRRKVREYLQDYLLTAEEFAEEYEKENPTASMDTGCAIYARFMQLALLGLRKDTHIFTEHEISCFCRLLTPSSRDTIKKLWNEPEVPERVKQERVKQEMRKYFKVGETIEEQILTRKEYLAEYPGAAAKYDAILSSLKAFAHGVPGSEFSFQDACDLRSMLKPEHRHKIKDLYMTGTSIKTGKLVEFCVEKTPHSSRAKTAQASGAHPMAFKPANIDGIGDVTDGGAFENTPVRSVEKYELNNKARRSGKNFTTTNLIFVLRENPDPKNDAVVNYHRNVLGSATSAPPSITKRIVTGGVSRSLTGVNSVARGSDSQAAIKKRSHRVVPLDVGNIKTLHGVVHANEHLPLYIKIGIEKAEQTLNEFLTLREGEAVHKNYETLEELLSNCTTAELFAVYHSEVISLNESEFVFNLLILRNEVILELNADKINKVELKRKVKAITALFLDKENAMKVYSVLNQETNGKLFDAFGSDDPIVSSLQWCDEACKKANKLLQKLETARNEKQGSSPFSVSTQAKLLDIIIKYLEDLISRGGYVRKEDGKFESALQNLLEAESPYQLIVLDIAHLMSNIPVAINNSTPTPQPRRRAALRINAESSSSSAVLSSGLSDATNSPNSPLSSPKEIEGLLKNIEQMINEKQFLMATNYHKKALRCLSSMPDCDSNKEFYRQELKRLSNRRRIEKERALISEAEQAISDKNFNEADSYISKSVMGLSCMADGAQKDSYAAELASIAQQRSVEKTYTLMEQTLRKAGQAIDNKEFDEAKIQLDKAARLLSKIIDTVKEALYSEDIKKHLLRLNAERKQYMTSQPNISLLSQSSMSTQSSHTPRQGSSRMFMSGWFGMGNREENRAESTPHFISEAKKAIANKKFDEATICLNKAAALLPQIANEAQRTACNAELVQLLQQRSVAEAITRAEVAIGNRDFSVAEEHIKRAVMALPSIKKEDKEVYGNRLKQLGQEINLCMKISTMIVNIKTELANSMIDDSGDLDAAAKFLQQAKNFCSSIENKNLKKLYSDELEKVSLSLAQENEKCASKRQPSAAR